MINYQKDAEYYAGGFDPNKEEYVITYSMSGKATRFSEKIKNNVGDYVFQNMAKEYITLNGDFYTIDYNSNSLYLESVSGHSTQWGEDIKHRIGFVVNENPLLIKQYLSLATQSDVSFDVELRTDSNITYINREEFEKKEDVYYVDIPRSIQEGDEALFGVGVIDYIIDNKSFRLKGKASNVNEGDKVYFDDGIFMGTVDSINNDIIFLEIDFINVPNENNFVYCGRPFFVEGEPLKGNYCEITMYLNESKEFTLKSTTTQTNISSMT
jgi:hypothetical protein